MENSVLVFNSRCIRFTHRFSAFEKWYYTTYWVENNVLHVKQGLFVKKESYLNKERVQTINTSSNVLYQMLGLKKIQIETAGGATMQKLA